MNIDLIFKKDVNYYKNKIRKLNSMKENITYFQDNKFHRLQRIVVIKRNIADIFCGGKASITPTISEQVEMLKKIIKQRF